MSEKQLEANRQNAQKSTGPKTPEGRAVSKMNATKHGILSKEVLVQGMVVKESRREFAALHQRFWDDLIPVGPMEEMLVDQIVTIQWRLRRVLKAEAGEIALSVDGGHWSRSKRDPLLLSMEWHALGDPIRPMEDSALGTRILLSWLNQVRAAVEKEGELTEDAIKIVFMHGKPNSLSQKLDELRAWFVNNHEGLEMPALRAKHQEQVFKFIESKLSLLSWQKSRCEERENKEEEALQAAATLPSMEVLDKIMRYETKLHKQLARAMTQLERLQRMRQGENVPPPLAVDVTEKE